MELIPLYILSDRDNVPIPCSDFEVTVPIEYEHLFSTIIIHDDDGGPYEAIVLGMSIDGRSSCELMTYRPQEIIENLHRIGVLCRVVSRLVSHTEILFEVEVERRLHVRDIAIYSLEEGNALAASIENVVEDNNKEAFGRLKEILNLTKTHKNTISFEVPDLVYESKDLDLICNTLCDLLCTERETKLSFIQSEDANERVNTVLKFLVGLSGNKKKKKKKAPAPVEPSPISLEERLARPEIPQDIKNRIARDIERFKNLPASSLEQANIGDYLNWVAELPWGVYSYQPMDLRYLTSEMDASHYGLQDVKQHIVEHMAIESILQRPAGSIICFAGPPGTGKTSLATTIAKVTNRKLIRFALGGLSDEAEIRGHRRTYVSSRPGRVVTGLKTANTMDPLFLLDEIDKLNRSNRGGDITSAMLELLDPEQNAFFIDRYLEFPIDLSQATFICTANEEDQIPDALRDRMEFIYFRQYTEPERLVIAKDYILPKATKEYGLHEYSVVFTDDVLNSLALIPEIREIGKKIRKLLRMGAAAALLDSTKELHIDADFCKEVIKIKTNRKTVGF